MRRLLPLLFALLLAAPARPETITVSAAISLKESLIEIGKAYHDQTGDDVQFTFGASGTLATQIRHGAPVDAFISAADAQVKELIDANLADKGSRRVIATNALVLIVPADAVNPPRSLADLATDNVHKIAAGDPKVVPAGQYADQAFKSLKLEGKLRDKLVYGGSVRQVLAYVERGAVDAGLVYKTDAIEAGAKVKVIATVDPKLHDKIEYPAVVISASAKRDAARKFLDFLATDKAEAILTGKGFTVPERKQQGGKE
jgi:molybdate transport system substrate-binding protein